MHGRPEKFMDDTHPNFFEIEIDRDGLRSYFRRSWLRAWLLSLSFFGGLFGFLSSIGRIEDGGAGSLGHLVFLLISGIVYGILIGAVIALLLYFLLSHFRAKKISEAQYIRVEGAYLQVAHLAGSTRVNRKIHFRAMTDFSLIENKRMQRYGIKALQMNTTGGGPGSLIRIDGVKDCDRVRDMLAEIDSIRENQIA